MKKPLLATAALFACLSLPTFAQMSSDPSATTSPPAVTPVPDTSARPVTPDASASPSLPNASSTAGASSTQRRALKLRQGQTADQAFSALDTNGDGMISSEEARANPDLIVLFVDSDTNSDQMLSPQEFLLIPVVPEDGTSSAQ